MVLIEVQDQGSVKHLLVEGKRLPLLPGIPRHDSLVPPEILKVIVITAKLNISCELDSVIVESEDVFAFLYYDDRRSNYSSINMGTWL
jgi:hypothetical protein